MAKPPPTPPSSDLQGVNRDARAGATPPHHPDPAGAINDAKEGSAARPEQSPPAERGVGQHRDED